MSSVQCCDAQLEPVSVCGLSQHFSSSCLLFVFRRLERVVQQQLTTPLKVVEARVSR